MDIHNNIHLQTNSKSIRLSGYPDTVGGLTVKELMYWSRQCMIPWSKIKYISIFF